MSNEEKEDNIIENPEEAVFVVSRLLPTTKPPHYPLTICSRKKKLWYSAGVTIMIGLGYLLV